jgi:hypothetical protein
MGTISASTPFFAYFWASLTGGGSGGSIGGNTGGGTGGDPAGNRPNPVKERVKAFFKTKAGKDCQKYFNDPSHSNRPNTSWIEHIATYAEFVDTRGKGQANKTFAQKGLTPPDGVSFNDKISLWLGPGRAPNGNIYSAFTDLSENTSWRAFTGSNFANLSPGQQAIVTTHEILHMAYHFDDVGIAAAVGITVAKGADPSEAISFWLAAGCPEHYTYNPQK